MMDNFDSLKITEALVGDGYRHDYLNNVFFRQAVDTLVQMLPYWIDGLAFKAAEEAERIEHLRADIEGMYFKPVMQPPQDYGPMPNQRTKS